MRLTLKTFLGLAFCCGIFAPQTLQALEYGIAPPTRKILAETPLPEGQSIELSVARNEWEGFQIVITTDAALADINLTLSDPTTSDGVTLSADRAIIYLEHSVDVVNPSSMSMPNHEREPGLYPDPLILFYDPYCSEKKAVAAGFDLSAGERAVLYIDWYVPIDATEGIYNGTATLTAAGNIAVEIPIQIEVWEFELPAYKSVGTAFSMSTDLPRRFHGGPAGTEPDISAEVLDNYYRVMHEHRIDPTHLKGPVEFNFDDDGNLLPIDWTGYDAFIGPWLDGTKFDDGIGVTRFNVRYFRPGNGIGSMTEDQYALAAKAFAEHLVEKGWWDNAYIYSTDEPWLNGGDDEYLQIKHDAELLNRYTDLWRYKVLTTGPLHELLIGYVGIWCPVSSMYEHWLMPANVAGYEEYAERRALGEELWFYVCNANFPPHAGYDIDTKIGYEPRIVKWSSWFEGATGFLYWRMTYWVDDDPWNVLSNPEQFTAAGARNGDGFLFYPGDHNGTAAPKGSPEGVAIDGPIVSYRLKQIRDGLEDWELFILASDLGAEQYTRQQVGLAHNRFGDLPWPDCDNEFAYCPEREPWTLDENVLLQARKNIAAKILYILYPDKYTDPEAPGEEATGESAPLPNINKSHGPCQTAPDETAPLGWLIFGLLAIVALRLRMQIPGNLIWKRK
jgi:Glycoside hydrolase 123, catalytic domain